MAEATTVAVSKKIDCKSSNIHVMKNETIGAVYCKETNTFCSLAPEDADRLLEIQKKVDQGIEDEDTAFMEDVILQAFGDDERVQVKEPERFDQTGELQWLEIVMQTDCNLRCKYCYAHGGSYDYGRIKMSPEMAREYITSLIDLPIRKIGSVRFFGGEPLGNPEAILAVCETLRELVEQGKLERMPELGLITNGTYYSKSISDMILKYNISVTFSIDGPSEINNQLRIYPNGKGSSQIVFDNIKRFLADGLKNYATESTYTKLHQKSGISHEDVCRYIYEKFGIQQTMVMNCRGESSEIAFNTLEDIEEEVRTISASYDMLSEGKSIYNLDTIIPIKRLKNKILNNCKCVSGLSSLSIAPDGKFYPCRMFLYDSQYCCGEYNGTSWNLDKYNLAYQNILLANREQICDHCWAQYICVDCPYWAELDKVNCKKMKVVETVIMKLVEINERNGGLQFIERLRI